MEEKNQIFKVQIDGGEVKDAELLTVVTIGEKEYAIYTVENENGTVDVLASYVQQDENGYDVLVDITDEGDRAKIAEVIKDLATSKN